MREIRFKPQLSCSVCKEVCSEIFCCEHEQIQVSLDYETFVEEMNRRLKEGVTSKGNIEEVNGKMWVRYGTKEDYYEEQRQKKEAMIVPKRKLADRILGRIRRWKFSVVLWWKCHIY